MIVPPLPLGNGSVVETGLGGEAGGQTACGIVVATGDVVGAVVGGVVATGDVDALAEAVGADEAPAEADAIGDGDATGVDDALADGVGDADDDGTALAVTDALTAGVGDDVVETADGSGPGFGTFAPPPHEARATELATERHASRRER